MRLLLIRHGQTPHNVTGALDTAFPGAGLTPLGEAQARAIPEALAGEDIAGVYASRLVRTQLTAAPLAESRGLDVGVCAGLEEIAAGDLEMRADSDAVHAYAGCLVSWMRGDLERSMPGGIVGHEFYDRYETALRTIVKEHDPGDTLAVFSHGAAIRVYTALSARLAPEVSTELRIMNTGMGVLEGDRETGWELARWCSEPLGGLELEDRQAHDVTGESAEEAIHEP
ncbi:MAG TPA: histidine phosphatase family protein [Marmoricola sp.]|nr:histidine phosphatase family protein [Marmoricola sp.]